MLSLFLSHDRVPAKTGHRGSNQLQQVQGWEWRGSGGCGDGALSPERGRGQRRQQGQHGQVQVGSGARGPSHCHTYNFYDVLMFCNIFSAQVPPVPSLPPPEPAAVARPRLLVLALPQTSWDAGQITVSFCFNFLTWVIAWSSMIHFLIWFSICWFDYPFPDFMNS